ncbi:MAG: dockerin type I domain-containing protein [Candidatus Stygibacter frigidus]|nr:dockerin type I domain-containing protein [Candidatus Stygibacter frigidus]
MNEAENHVGIGISELVLLSSMEEDLGHIGEGISDLVYLSSMEEDFGHIGEGLSALCLLSSVRYGDVDNNTLVESFDASLVLQYFCQMEPQGVPLPWEDWRQTIADVDGNTAIEAYDASLMLMYSVDLIDIFPVEEEPVVTRKEGRSSTAKGAK